MRILQIKQGVAVAEWSGGGRGPIPPDASWVFVNVTDRPSAQVGDTYDVALDAFTAPAPPADWGRQVDAREFLLRFTREERKAIRIMAESDADVADWLDLAQVPVPIRLKHPITLAGLDALVAKGILSAERKSQIIQ